MTPPLDFNTIAMLRRLVADGAPDPMIEIRSMFVEDGSAHLRTLGAAVEAGDETSARRIAACLKAMSGTIGARQLCALSDRLEQTLPGAIARDQVSQLELEFVRVAAVLLEA
jgi:HPt (histidine-containing phosphotransfer) domain-containing protein